MATTPHTFVAGVDHTTAPYLNSHTDAISEVQNPACVWVYNSANISIADSTATVITFNTELYDAFAMHGVGGAHLTIPSGWDGDWEWDLKIQWASSATGYREVRARLNGATDIWLDRRPAFATFASHQACHVPAYPMVAGDYMELVVTQTSGGALNATAAGVHGIAMVGRWVGA